MKEKISDLLKSIFGLSMMISVLMGAVVLVIFIIGFIISGPMGEQLAVSGGKIMKYCITLSAIGSVIGMLAFYIEGKHELTMNEKQENKETVSA